MRIVETQALRKVYGNGETAVTALHDIDLQIGAGEFVAVMGPSGCGKSTLLQLLGGLDHPTSGSIQIAGAALDGRNDDDLAALRRRTIGFIFQSYNLIPVLSALENAALPLMLDGVAPAQACQRAATWLERLGLAQRAHHHPHELSGGQQQRVAIARALVGEPALILADEPTGNLDSRAAAEIADLLAQITGEWGRTILMVTHDPRMAVVAGRLITMRDGALVSDQPARSLTQASTELVTG